MKIVQGGNFHKSGIEYSPVTEGWGSPFSSGSKLRVCFFFTLVTDPGRSLSLKLNNSRDVPGIVSYRGKGGRCRVQDSRFRV
jgi:hypothetical protein